MARVRELARGLSLADLRDRIEAGMEETILKNSSSGIVGTLLSKDPEAERRYDELSVRSLTGAGAEKATSH